MASGTGPSLGAAVHDLLRVSPREHRSLKQQLHYLTAKTTGASVPSVARQLDTSPKTVRIWISGERPPTKANRDRIARLFDRFWEINNRSAPGRNPGDRMLRVTGPVYVHGKQRTSVIVEKGRRARDWEALRTSSAEDISKDKGLLFINALDIPIPYLEFRRGHYRITIL